MKARILGVDVCGVCGKSFRGWEPIYHPDSTKGLVHKGCMPR